MLVDISRNIIKRHFKEYFTGRQYNNNRKSNRYRFLYFALFLRTFSYTYITYVLHHYKINVKYQNNCW